MLARETRERQEAGESFDSLVEASLTFLTTERSPSLHEYAQVAFVDMLRWVADRLLLGSSLNVSDGQRELVLRLATVGHFLKDPATLVQKWQAACGGESPVNFTTEPNISELVVRECTQVSEQFQGAINRLNARLAPCDPRTVEAWAAALDTEVAKRGYFSEPSVRALQAALGSFVTEETEVQRSVVSLMYALNRASQVIEYLDGRYSDADANGRSNLVLIVKSQMAHMQQRTERLFRDFSDMVEAVYLRAGLS